MISVVVPLGPVARLEVTGATTPEVLADLTAVKNSEIPMVLGNVLKGMEAEESLGRVLGAELVETHQKAPSPGPQQSAEDQEGIPDWATVVPGAPVINGKPAWLRTMMVDGKQTSVFVHPSLTIDPSLPRTADPNDPRLKEGGAIFFAPMK